jgi:zinc transport system permease protein
MQLTAMLDPMFRLALLDGLVLAAVLPIIGALLTLRDEWLAALGYAQIGAAGALLALVAGLPAVLGGLAAAAAGALVKGAGAAAGNAVYGFMMLAGWSALLLIGANSSAGEQVAQALVQGQLYFAGVADIAAALLLVLAAAVLLPWLMPRLLRLRLLPHHDGANARPVRRWLLAFDLLAASAMAVAAASMGVMAAFALVLAPAWLAFRHAPSWRWTWLLSSAIGVLGYLIAFAVALALDQPFGPVLVVVLLAGVAVGLRPWPNAHPGRDTSAGFRHPGDSDP